MEKRQQEEEEEEEEEEEGEDELEAGGKRMARADHGVPALL